jgi:trans-feruloyl-CoA hydratase/vanillin synthase
LDYETIAIERESGTATVSLNRPQKKNAMSPQMHREMLDALGKLADDDAVRVLILTGKGDSFCSGQDLKEFFAETYGEPAKSRKITDLAMQWAEKLRLFPKPTIAAVNGWCLGGGLRIMALCDLAIASDKAMFGLPEVNFGIFPAGGAMKAAMEVLSHRDAMYWALTGERLTAEEADRLRLVNRVVPHERLLEECRALARKLTEKNPVALMLTKEVFWRDKYMNYQEAVDWELANFSVLTYLQGGEWVQQGIPQFIQGKYKPGKGSSYQSNPKGNPKGRGK